jgi:hypothetical protein
MHCIEKRLRVGPSTLPLKKINLKHGAGADKVFIQNARLLCNAEGDVGRCAYGSAANEERPPPAGTVGTVHLDPTGEGPDDWYLTEQDGVVRALDPTHPEHKDTATVFTVGRYDAARGWRYPHLEIAYDECVPTWRANLSVSVKPMAVVGDAKVEELLSEAVFLGFGVLFFYCGAVFNYFLLLLNMVREKEHKLRTAMLMMGLSRGSLWASWLLYSVSTRY